MASTRKTDRRTIYTRRVVKDAFLELLEEHPYERINVTMLCKQAEITRATFYLHYTDLNQVLDEVIEEAVAIAEDHSYLKHFGKRQKALMDVLKEGPEALYGNENLLPPCQRIADDPKYRPLFMDDGLSYYVIHKVYMMEREYAIPYFVEQGGISEEDANRIFQMILYGLFYVNRSMKWQKNDDWYRIQYLINYLIFGGLERIIQLPDEHRTFGKDK